MRASIITLLLLIAGVQLTGAQTPNTSPAPTKTEQEIINLSKTNGFGWPTKILIR
jgi:hypothetical protein